METIYGHSYCNIAAVDSSDGSGGLFRPREVHEVLPSEVKSSSPLLGNRTYKVVRQDFWEGELLEEPLYRRAWVFQGKIASMTQSNSKDIDKIRSERMLSQRLLHFGKHQIFWECPSLCACEAFPNGLPVGLEGKAREGLEWKETLQAGYLNKGLSTRGLQRLPSYKFWRESVFNYTSCELTVETDKLVAIAGIARLLRHALAERYLAGLWENNLEEQLAWKVVDCKKASGAPSTRQVKYRAPSWSWASVDGVVELQRQAPQPRTYKAKLEAKVQPAANLDNIAWVTGGSLEVQGQLGSMRFSRKEAQGAIWKPQTTFKALQDSLVEAFPDLDPKGDVQDWYFLPLAYTKVPARFEVPGYTGHALLLQKVVDQDGHFSRVGAMYFTGLDTVAWRAIEQAYVKVHDPCTSQGYDRRAGHKITVI